MKKNFLLLGGLICSLFLIASCDKENENSEWKSIPSEEISAASATFTVNGVKSTSGGVTVNAESATSANVVLNGIVPGYETITVPAALSTTDEAGIYSFTGSTIMTEGPSILLKSTAVETQEGFQISVTGTISLDGAAEVAVTTSLSNEFKGTLVGTWKVNRVAPVEDEAPVSGPVWINWTLKESSSYALLPNYAKIGSILLGSQYTDHFDAFTLLDNGTMALKIWDGDTDDNSPTPDADGNYVYGSTHEDWIDLPLENQVFWFVKDGYFYLVPNADALVDDDDAITSEKIAEVLEELEVMQVDTEALKAELAKIQKNGIAFKYTQEADALKIYVDKAMIDPFITALAPALPYIDIMFEEMGRSEDESEQETYKEIKVVLKMLGLEKPSDLQKVWADTTEFQIELNFTK